MEPLSDISNRKNDTDNSLAQKFYKPTIRKSNRNWSECVLHLRKTYKELQSKPLPSVFKSRLEGPSVTWKSFKRLSLAASYADSCTKDCMVFSYEERTPENSGQRMFLVAHPQHMWLNHKLRPPDCRCSYEVIRENSPCKLYFDLEFNKTINPTKDGNKLTKTFIECIIAAVLEVYNVHLQASHFLWLDASTGQKFSSHLIVQMPNIAFQNNVVAGSFVSLLLSKIISRITNNTFSNDLWPSWEDLKSLLIQKSDGKNVIFCDSAVYTKNRNFRLYLSTKYGKRAPLLLSEHNQYVPEASSGKERDELIFYDSLITYFRSATTCMRLLFSTQNNVPDVIPRDSLSSSSRTDNAGFSQRGPSPFPEVDRFILTQVKDFKATGFIRKWTYLEKEEILLYEIGSYRFCSNINRHHKSNNIMLIVDMKRKHYYQKCYDPECRLQNFKSNAKPLPTFITSLYSYSEDFFDDNCFSQLRSEPTEANPNFCVDSAMGLDNGNDMAVDDSFFEELNPFTQLSKPAETEIVSNASFLKEPQKQQLNNPDEIETLLEDEYFDGISIDELECVNSEKHDDKEEKKPSPPDEISTEDEIMMAEAADVLECSFDNGDLFSEETIF